MPDSSVIDQATSARTAGSPAVENGAEVKRLSPQERQVFDAVGVANKALLEYRYGSDAPISSEQISREAEKVSGDALNQVRKQEPMVNKSILASMILQGAEANGASIGNSEKIAVILHDARNLNPEKLGDDAIRKQFGDELGQKVITDLNGIDSAMQGDPAAKARYGKEVAALEVAELRMAVRSVGDQAILGEKAGPGFLSPDSPKFDEAILHAQQALASPGVDPSMYNGADTLIKAARDVSRGAAPAAELTEGPHSAVPEFQNGLASVAPYQQGAYNADETALNRTLRSSFEVSRYQVHNRRKDGTPDVNHALEVAGYDKSSLDANALSARMLHDLNEDRYWDPYSAKPEQVYSRFGPVVAGTVAEATDLQPTPEQLDAIRQIRQTQGDEAATVAEKKLSRSLGEQSEKQYAQKARLFSETPLTRSENTYSRLGAEHHEDAVNRAANPDLPFTVEGALTKIADWRQSMQSTLNNPERVTDPRSASSGFMLGVQRKKEGFIQPLVETLASPQRRSELEALGVNTQEVDAQLKGYADTSRKYTELALDTAAKERGLSPENTEKLKELYFDSAKSGESPEAFRQQLESIGFTDREVTGKDGKTRLVADNVAPGTDAGLAITSDNLQKNRANAQRLREAVHGPEAGIPQDAAAQIEALNRMYAKSAEKDPEGKEASGRQGTTPETVTKAELPQKAPESSRAATLSTVDSDREFGLGKAEAPLAEKPFAPAPSEASSVALPSGPASTPVITEVSGNPAPAVSSTPATPASPASTPSSPAATAGTPAPAVSTPASQSSSAASAAGPASPAASPPGGAAQPAAANATVTTGDVAGKSTPNTGAPVMAPSTPTAQAPSTAPAASTPQPQAEISSNAVKASAAAAATATLSEAKSAPAAHSPESAPASATHTETAPHPAETSSPHTEPVNAGPHKAGAGAGLALGSFGLVNALRNHDGWGALTSGANVALSARELQLTLKSAGELTPELASKLDKIGKANVILTVVDGAVQISREDGANHKLQRTAVVGGVAATGALAGAAGGGLLSTVALPAAVGYAGEKTLDVVRTRETVNNDIAAIKPELNTHSHLLVEEVQFRKQLDAAGVTKDAQGHYDMTNQSNADKMSRILKQHEADIQKTINANETGKYTPVVTDKQADMLSRKNLAQDELARTQAAEVELGDKYLKAHQDALAAVQSSSHLFSGGRIVSTIQAPTSTTPLPQTQLQR